MTPSPDEVVESLRDRVARLRRMRGPRPAAAAGPETVGGGDELPASPPEIARYIDRARHELNRIVRDYLGGDPRLYVVADDIAARGGRALRLVGEGTDPDGDFLAGFEAVVRSDGSRPSFLVRNGEIDRASSPLGSWGAYLDADAEALRRAVAGVGRIDNPADPVAGYAGTGFLVAPNLVLTNRHVLQAIGWRGDGGAWALQPDVAIDFGHEFRGRETVGRRRLLRVAFAGPTAVDTNAALNHAVLDLAAVELEPGPAAAAPFEVDASPDWAAGGGEVYTVGYPYRPRGGYTPTLLEQLFQQTFGYKRVAPGVAARPRRTTQPWTAAHDATTLGGNSGSVVVVAGRPTVAAALHYGGSAAEPAENWGHVFGRVLDQRDPAGRTLRDVLQQFGVAFRDRTVAPPPAGGAGGEVGVPE